MGPRLFSRGNYILASSARDFLKSFNGATAIQPWKQRLTPRFASGHLRASMGPRLFSRGNSVNRSVNRIKPSCFNGATAIQPWKHLSSLSTYQFVFASFNGATAIQPWKLRLPVPGNLNTACFNGATAIQPWKQQDGMWRYWREASLQWGHGYSAVETSLSYR